MAEPCQAHAHKYVGQGVTRVLHEGRCVLERGHDMDCLPPSLAMEGANNALRNAVIAEVKAVLDEHKLLDSDAKALIDITLAELIR